MCRAATVNAPSKPFARCAKTANMHYILFYDVDEQYLEKRRPHRAAHFAHAQRAHESGDLVLAGALQDPVDAAVFVFRGPTPEAARNFASSDPYVTSGVVKEWRIRNWTTVIGDGAVPPQL